MTSTKFALVNFEKEFSESGAKHVEKHTASGSSCTNYNSDKSFEKVLEFRTTFTRTIETLNCSLGRHC